MEQHDYEYRDLIALAWDPLRGDTSEWSDRLFYLNMIRHSGEPVLDVGCGTGRLLLDYVGQGIDLDGVDVSPDMLDICREKAQGLSLKPTLYLQHMESLDLPRRYRTILVPSSSFQLLTDLDDAFEALKRFHAHLEPGGTLVMSIMDLTAEEYTDEWYHCEALWPEDGAVVHRWSRATYDAQTQLEHTEDRYELVKDGEMVKSETFSRSPATRSYTQGQILTLFEKVGFVDVHALGYHSEQKATPDDAVIYVLGKLA